MDKPPDHLHHRSDRLLPLVGGLGVVIWIAGTMRLAGLNDFVADQLANLGAGVTSGGIVTWAVTVLQRRSEELAKEHENQLRVSMERRQMAMSLSLQTDLAGVTLAELDLRGLVLSRKRFCGAVLRKSDLRGVRLDGADLSDADLSEAQLEGADLRGARFTRAELSRAQLQRADLRGADLTQADLSYSNLSGADLTGASLAGANLYNAVIGGACFKDADLSGIDENVLLSLNLKK